MTQSLKKYFAVAASLAILSPAPSWAAVAGRALAGPRAAGVGSAGVSAVPSFMTGGALKLAPIGASSNAPSKAPSLLPKPAVRTPNAAVQRPVAALSAVAPAAVRAAAALRPSAAGIGAAAPAKVGVFSRPMAGAVRKAVERFSEASRGRQSPAVDADSVAELGSLFDGAVAPGLEELFHPITREQARQVQEFAPHDKAVQDIDADDARQRAWLAPLWDGLFNPDPRDLAVVQKIDVLRKAIETETDPERRGEIVREMEFLQALIGLYATRVAAAERFPRVRDKVKALLAPQAPAPGWRAWLGVGLQSGGIYAATVASGLFAAFALTNGFPLATILGGYAFAWTTGFFSAGIGGNLLRAAGREKSALDVRQAAAASFAGVASGAAAGFLVHVIVDAFMGASAGAAALGAVLPAVTGKRTAEQQLEPTLASKRPAWRIAVRAAVPGLLWLGLSGGMLGLLAAHWTSAAAAVMGPVVLLSLLVIFIWGSIVSYNALSSPGRFGHEAASSGGNYKASVGTSWGYGGESVIRLKSRSGEILGEILLPHGRYRAVPSDDGMKVVVAGGPVPGREELLVFERTSEGFRRAGDPTPLGSRTRSLKMTSGGEYLLAALRGRRLALFKAAGSGYERVLETSEIYGAISKMEADGDGLTIETRADLVYWLDREVEDLVRIYRLLPEPGPGPRRFQLKMTKEFTE